jgi:hypothetical protein
MGTEAPTIVTIPVRCAPEKAPCPTRGQTQKRGTEKPAMMVLDRKQGRTGNRDGPEWR